MYEQPDSMGRYEEAAAEVIRLVRGEGFLAPGGAETIRGIVRGLDLNGRLVLDVGCGLGGSDVILARDYGAQVVALDVEVARCRRGRELVTREGLEERIDIRQFDPGLLPIEDVSVDVVFGEDSRFRSGDDGAFFGEVFRVLRPGGVLCTGEWMKAPGPCGADTERLFALQGRRRAPGTPEDARATLEECGFTAVEVIDASEQYRVQVQREYESMRGPLAADMREFLGPELQERVSGEWRTLASMLDKGALRAGWVRAVKAAP